MGKADIDALEKEVSIDIADLRRDIRNLRKDLRLPDKGSLVHTRQELVAATSAAAGAKRRNSALQA